MSRSTAVSPKTVRVSEFDYPLPDRAVAQRPPDRRNGARLLTVAPSGYEHGCVTEFVERVPPGSLVVLNDTRVRKARIVAAKSTGGRAEVLFLRRTQEGNDRLWSALVSSNRKLRAGTLLYVGPATICLRERSVEGDVEVELDVEGDVEEFFSQHGHVPLPPYIRRPDDVADDARYQTVFADRQGSAAAPTAGLHLTRDMLDRLRQRGVEVGRVTLHVGAGTFLPVRCDDLNEHPMHAERFRVTEELREQVSAARKRGAAVVAVGTTVVRALESAGRGAPHRMVRSCEEETRLLIQPGDRLSVVDSLLTNFHAPRSTLLALVSAFLGTQRCREAYELALEQGYRFLSYGDAMWIPEAISSCPGGVSIDRE